MIEKVLLVAVVILFALAFVGMAAAFLSSKPGCLPEQELRQTHSTPIWTGKVLVVVPHYGCVTK